MKKLLALLLAVLMITGLCACSEEKKDSGQITQISDDIALLSFRFTDEVRAVDGECTGTSYPKIDGKVYVDLVFSVDNNTAQSFGPNSISGVLTYQDTKYDLQYCRESDSSIGVSEDPVAPDEYARVHLFTCLPGEAESADLTVSYTVNGEEYSCKVGAKQTEDPLAAKTKVKQGDKISVLDGAYEFEVLETKIMENLQASKQTDSYFMGPFAVVKLNVTNHHATRTLPDIFGYTMIGEEIGRISTDTETENNTDLDPLLDVGIAPGESRLVYIYLKVQDDMSTEDLMIRFNLAGSCYYAEIE